MYEEYIELFIEKANAKHPAIKLTTELSEIETTFLVTTVYNAEGFEKKASWMCVHILTLLKHYSAHTSTAVTQRAIKRGFVKGEGLRLLRTNSFKEVKHERKEALKQKLRTWKRFHPLSRSFNRHFQTWKTYGQWHLIQNKPWLREIFKELPNCSLIEKESR